MKRLYHALPRMLGLYFDAATQLHDVLQQPPARAGGGAGRAAVHRAAEQLHQAMRDVVDRAPAYVLYAGLYQIISRITHPSPDVLTLLGVAVRKVMAHFPERAAWALMGVHNSTKQNTNRRANLKQYVLTPMKAEPVKFDKALQAFEQALTATEAINLLAELQVKSGERTLRFDRLDCTKPLSRRLPLSLVVPTEEQLGLLLPSGAVPLGGEPFPHAATILRFDNDIAVMSSLQKPKKVTVVTSTGERQGFLCKARDELRKDARIMELCTIMNLLLAKNRETRQRELRLKTFAVTMTGDDSGMIEWVNGVEPFRCICDSLYNKSPHGMTTAEIKPWNKQVQQKRITAVQCYRERILPQFPPLMHKWFVQEFADPIAWFTARNAFTKTSAVWSIVGNVVGLGDRHGENILIDTKTGEAMHVDFAILFDKGMSLEVPEIVRFRLTPNMVDGMGLSGHEGIFRRCAELTMEIMRAHKDMVMGVLNLFLHDPLIDWTPKESRRQQNRNPAGPADWKPQAEQQLGKIRRRLDGYFDDPAETRRAREESAAPLNVQGQVRELIKNATSPDNLGNMYIWWMPWL